MRECILLGSPATLNLPIFVTPSPPTDIFSVSCLCEGKRKNMGLAPVLVPTHSWNPGSYTGNGANRAWCLTHRPYQDRWPRGFTVTCCFSVPYLSNWKFQRLGGHLDEIVTVIIPCHDFGWWCHLIRKMRCQDVGCFMYFVEINHKKWFQI